jgi:hypothetical protein
MGVWVANAQSQRNFLAICVLVASFAYKLHTLCFFLAYHMRILLIICT